MPGTALPSPLGRWHCSESPLPHLPDRDEPRALGETPPGSAPLPTTPKSASLTLCLPGQAQTELSCPSWGRGRHSQASHSD